MKTQDGCGKERKRNARGEVSGRMHTGTRRKHKMKGERTQRRTQGEHTGSTIDATRNDAPPRECNQTKSVQRGNGGTGLSIRKGGTAPGRTTLHACNYEFLSTVLLL